MAGLQPKRLQRSLIVTFKGRPQLGEETSAANPEPQRQAQTNGGTTQPEDPLIIETD